MRRRRKIDQHICQSSLLPSPRSRVHLSSGIKESVHALSFIFRCCKPDRLLCFENHFVTNGHKVPCQQKSYLSMNEGSVMEAPTLPLALVVASGITTLVLASALTYILMSRKKRYVDRSNLLEAVWACLLIISLIYFDSLIRS
jgi:hypothetical protein